MITITAWAGSFRLLSRDLPFAYRQVLFPALLATDFSLAVVGYRAFLHLFCTASNFANYMF